MKVQEVEKYQFFKRIIHRTRRFHGNPPKKYFRLFPGNEVD